MYAEIVNNIRDIIRGYGVDIVEENINMLGDTLDVKVLVDYPYGGIDMKVCSQINRAIVSFLEEKSDVVLDYNVEVSSPGLDRKLKSISDFRRNIQKLVTIYLHEKLHEKEQWEGKLVDVSSNCVVVEVEKKREKDIIKIPYSMINYGKVKLW